MHGKTSVFLRMFEIELEDLHKDVELLIDRYTDEHDHEVISNYVFLENIALMNNELFGIDSFLETVRHINPSHYDNVDELINVLTIQLQQRCRDKGYASSVCVLAGRKMDKVHAYLERTSPEWEKSGTGQFSARDRSLESLPLI